MLLPLFKETLNIGIMTKIRNIFNNGQRFGAKTGVVKIGSYNVCPDTITTDAAGSAATLTRAQMNQYDYFKVARTNGATDQFHLPDAAEVGESFALYSILPFEVHCEVTTGEINGTGSLGFDTLAKALYICTKTVDHATVDEWSVLQITEGGATTAVTVDVAK